MTQPRPQAAPTSPLEALRGAVYDWAHGPSERTAQALARLVGVAPDEVTADYLRASLPLDEQRLLLRPWCTWLECHKAAMEESVRACRPLPTSGWLLLYRAHPERSMIHEALLGQLRACATHMRYFHPTLRLWPAWSLEHNEPPFLATGALILSPGLLSPGLYTGFGSSPRMVPTGRFYGILEYPEHLQSLAADLRLANRATGGWIEAALWRSRLVEHFAHAYIWTQLAQAVGPCPPEAWLEHGWVL